jgi:glycosyltransferase involved in cell wall biosynthesis
LLALGRTAPVKGLPVVLRAVAIARSRGFDAQLRIVGPSTTAQEIEHRRELEALIANIALSAVVQIDDGVPHRQIPDLLRDSHVLVDAGADDDMSISTLEAMAAGRVVLTASTRVAAILPESQPVLSFEAANAFELADRIVGLDETWATGLPRIGNVLRQVVEREHSLDHWRRQFATAVDQARSRDAARTDPA